MTSGTDCMSSQHIWFFLVQNTSKWVSWIGREGSWYQMGVMEACSSPSCLTESKQNTYIFLTICFNFLLGPPETV